MGPKASTIATLLAMSFIWPFGINLILGRNGTYAGGGLFELVIFTCLVYRWYSLDRLERDYDASPLLNMAMMLVAVVGLPVYLVRSRGWKDGLAATFLAFIVLLVSAALTISGVLAARAIIA